MRRETARDLSTSLFIYLAIHLSVYLSIYIYLYIHIYTHIYIYIYIYMWVCVRCRGSEGPVGVGLGEVRTGDGLGRLRARIVQLQRLQHTRSLRLRVRETPLPAPHWCEFHRDLGPIRHLRPPFRTPGARREWQAPLPAPRLYLPGHGCIYTNRDLAFKSRPWYKYNRGLGVNTKSRIS